jgi:CheY-like chemotaxis protein
MKDITSILVVEDNLTSLDTISKLFSALNVQTVSKAASAEEAWEILKVQKKFSFIVTDYRLPGISGVDFVEQLRAKGDQTPIVVLSGAPDKAAVVRATNCGRVDFLGKPFKTAELVAAITKLYEQK